MIDPVRADTIRLLKCNEGYQVVGLSTNRGLECYIMEAMLSLESWHDAFRYLSLSASRIALQSEKHDGLSLWGWERKPTVPGVWYPPDWDDTCKAIDCILLWQNRTNLDIEKSFSLVLPCGSTWKRLTRESLFRGCSRSEIAGELALSVFFGPHATVLPQREDPMVTVTYLRSTKLWFPDVFTQLVDVMRRLFCRVNDVLGICLRELQSFVNMSRYYFSFGMFANTCLQTLLLSGFDPHDVMFPMQELRQYSYRKVDGILGNVTSITRSEERWWLVVANSLGYPSDLSGALRESIGLGATELDVVYRHRSLSHYYGAWAWASRLQTALCKTAVNAPINYH